MKQFTKWTRIFITVFCAAVTAQAQTESGPPYSCDHEYALCIAASCNEDGECGHCDEEDGSCGYCYVFKGPSTSYGKPCEDLEPNGKIVYSTYSEILAEDFNFKVMTCSSPAATADCMDAQCTKKDKTVPLTDKNNKVHDVHTAICKCRVNEKNPGGATLGGDCNTHQNCSAIWSTAGSVLNDQPRCSQ